MSAKLGRFLLIGLVTLCGGSAAAQDLDGLAALAAIEDSLTTAVRRAEPSLVSIARIRKLPPAVRQELRQSPPLARPADPEFIPNDFGSGVLIAPSNPDRAPRRTWLILTNYHVVRGGPIVGAPNQSNDSELYVRFANRRGGYARILAADPRSDLATLQVDLENIDVPSGSIKPIRFANLPAGQTRPIEKGQIVLVLGNPYAIARDGSASVSWGIVSNYARRSAPAVSADEDLRQRSLIHHMGTLLQIDARLNLGTSGGAVINTRGELVGLTTSLAALEGYEKASGFAVPMDAGVRRIIDALVRGYEVEYGFLGIHPEDVFLGDPTGLPASVTQPTWVKAAAVHPGSPADRGGLEDEDVILAVRPKRPPGPATPIYSRNDLTRTVGLLGPNAVVELTVARRGRSFTFPLEVVLGKWPVLDEEEIIATGARVPSWRGLTVDYPSGRIKYYTVPYRYHAAVVITEVRPGSEAALKKLDPGDFITHVNRTPVQTPADFLRAVETPRGDVTLRLLDGREVTLGD